MEITYTNNFVFNYTDVSFIKENYCQGLGFKPLTWEFLSISLVVLIFTSYKKDDGDNDMSVLNWIQLVISTYQLGQRCYSSKVLSDLLSENRDYNAVCLAWFISDNLSFYTMISDAISNLTSANKPILLCVNSIKFIFSYLFMMVQLGYMIQFTSRDRVNYNFWTLFKAVGIGEYWAVFGVIMAFIVVLMITQIIIILMIKSDLDSDDVKLKLFRAYLLPLGVMIDFVYIIGADAMLANSQWGNIQEWFWHDYNSRKISDYLSKYYPRI